jgi:hypothetical protein
LKFLEFDTPFEWSLILENFSDIDVLVVGLRVNSESSVPLGFETRENGVLDLLSKTGIESVEMTPIEVSLDGSVEGVAKGHYSVVTANGKSTEQVRWNELGDWVEKNWVDKHVAVDLTTLSGGLLFQLYAAIHASKSVRLSAVYFVPDTYPQVDSDNDLLPVVTRSIKQPHGYSSFANEYIKGSRKHVILLGFDRHRPNKFVEHYQWPISEVHALLGTPAFVASGEEQARKSLGPLYSQLEKLGQIHTVNPRLPISFGNQMGVCEQLMKLTEDADVIDIVPLGPKPTLLGCLIFYWQGIDELRRERVRFLYDFPTTRKQRTNGLRQIWLYKDLRLNCE